MDMTSHPWVGKPFRLIKTAWADSSFPSAWNILKQQCFFSRSKWQVQRISEKVYPQVMKHSNWGFSSHVADNTRILQDKHQRKGELYLPLNPVKFPLNWLVQSHAWVSMENHHLCWISTKCFNGFPPFPHHSPKKINNSKVHRGPDIHPSCQWRGHSPNGPRQWRGGRSVRAPEEEVVT